MPGNAFPPYTREECDDFFVDVVRARLVHLFSQSLLGGASPLHGATPVNTTQPVAQVSVAQLAGEFTCAHCQYRKYKEETDKEEKQKQKQKQVDHESNTHLCTPMPALSHRPDDLLWLDTRIAQSFSISIAAQRSHPSAPDPTPQGWVDWYQQFFSAVVGIAVLGAGFTFSVIFNDFSSPSTNMDDPEAVKQDAARQRYIRACLAAAWMLFVLSIGVTSGAALLIHVHRAKLIARFTRLLQNKERWWNSWPMTLLTVGGLLIQLIPIGAFVASAAAVRQYHEILGYVSMGIISMFALILIVLWCVQNLRRSKEPAKCMHDGEG